MRFYQTLLAGAALVAAALALEINDFPANPEAGKTYTIKYSPADNTPTQIILRKGSSGDLNTIGTIGTATGGTFQWTVDQALPSGSDYALEVRQGSVNNYSKQFPISGGSASPSSAASSAASSAVSSILSSLASSASASASASSAASVSSAASTLITSASGSPSSSVGSNSTIASPTLSPSSAVSTGGARTTGGSGSSPTTGGGGGAPQQTGTASSLGSSPLALIFGAVAAMVYLN